MSGQWSISTTLPNQNPTDLAIDSSGNIFASFPFADCIQKFSSSGTLMATIGTPYGPDPGSSDVGKFYAPMGLAVDSNGFVYVADAGNNRLEKFANSGVYVSVFYGQIPAALNFNSAVNVAVDPSGNIFVVDYISNSIKKFSNAYDPVAFTFGSTFDRPYGICFDGLGNIYVSDLSAVRKFSSTGAFITPIGTWTGNQPGLICVDSLSKVYVTAPLENKVYKFSPSGDSYVEATSWGSSGKGNGQFSYPDGIAVYDGNVYVADNQNLRIQKFTDSGVFQAEWLISDRSSSLPNFNPTCLATDKFGNIFVTISFSSCVLKLSSSGALLTTIGTPHAGSTAAGSAEGQFNQEKGIAVDGSGYVYVADFGNSRIEKFSPPAPVSQPSVVLSLIEGPYGSDFKITCSGFVPNADVTITLPWGYSSQTYRSDENGVVDRLSVVVPTEVDLRPYAITATQETPTGVRSATAYFTVTPLNTLVFETIGSAQTAGVPFSVKITAVDYLGNVLTSYTGYARLSCSNGAVILPLDVGGFVDGVWIGNVQISSAATAVSINAKATYGATGSSNSFIVAPALEVPEYPIGALAAIIPSLIAFAVYKKHGSWQIKRQN